MSDNRKELKPLFKQLDILKKEFPAVKSVTDEGDSVKIVLDKTNVTERSIEDEEIAYETFTDKNGNLFYSQPPIPLPAVVTTSESEITIVVKPITPDFGLVYERGQINFMRNIRFFLNEIFSNAYHFTNNSLNHPYNG